MIDFSPNISDIDKFILNHVIEQAKEHSEYSVYVYEARETLYSDGKTIVTKKPKNSPQFTKIIDYGSSVYRTNKNRNLYLNGKQVPEIIAKDLYDSSHFRLTYEERVMFNFKITD